LKIKHKLYTDYIQPPGQSPPPPPFQLHGCAPAAMEFKKFCILLLQPKSIILLYRGSSEIHI
jgi:hypothetical protein